jgi:hypothetical protein
VPCEPKGGWSAQGGPKCWEGWGQPKRVPTLGLERPRAAQCWAEAKGDRRSLGPKSPSKARLDHFRPGPGVPKCWRQEGAGAGPNRGEAAGARLDRAGPDCGAGAWGDEAKGTRESPGAGGDKLPRAAHTRAPRGGRGSWDERKCQGEGSAAAGDQPKCRRPVLLALEIP